MYVFLRENVRYICYLISTHCSLLCIVYTINIVLIAVIERNKILLV